MNLDPATVSNSIGSIFVHWDGWSPPAETPNGARRNIFDGPTPTLERFELHVTTLNPGREPHAAHHHAHEEIILVKTGEVEVTINGNPQRAPADALVFIASHDLHHLKNVGAVPATYYVINFHTEASARVPDRSAAQLAVPGKLPSSVIAWDSVVPKETKSKDVRRPFVESPTHTFTRLAVHATTMAVGRPVSSHAGHRWAMMIVIKESVLEYCVDGVTTRVGPGSIVYMAQGSAHTVKNVGPVPSVYYVIAVSSEKTPAA